MPHASSSPSFSSASRTTPSRDTLPGGAISQTLD
jgi:hypothetical protein